jgi:hypothetical protein
MRQEGVVKLWHLAGALGVALGLALIASCGDSFDADPDEGPRNVAFTPLPTLPPPTILCGNGCIDTAAGENCDLGTDEMPECPPQPNGGCADGTTCVCCVCLEEGETLGERTFTVARPASQFLSTGQGGTDVSRDPWLMGPLVLGAGRPDPELPPDPMFPDDNCEVEQAPPFPSTAVCSAPLSLSEDTIIGFNDPISGTVCVKFFAEGSTGFIDCDGGSAHAVNMSIDSNGPGEEGELMICRNLGLPTAGPGAATLRIARTVNIRVQPQFPVPRAEDLCPMLNYDDPFGGNPGFDINPADILVAPIVFTTQVSAGEVLNPQPPSPTLLPPAAGENFLCAGFTETDSPGGLVGNLPALDNPLVGDTVNAVILFDRNRPQAE